MEKKTHVLIHDDCIACGICQMACSLSHSDKISPSLSRITIIRGKASNNVIGVCHQCETPMCMKVCPADALSKDPETNATVRNDNCVGCKNCIFACPIGAIFMDEDSSITVCDTCEGDPYCVKFCPKEAIRHLTDDEAKYVMARIAAAKVMNETTSERETEVTYGC